MINAVGTVHDMIIKK